MLVADELDDAGQVTLGADFVRGEWSRPGFDLATDAWVAGDGEERIVGTETPSGRENSSFWMIWPHIRR